MSIFPPSLKFESRVVNAPITLNSSSESQPPSSKQTHSHLLPLLALILLFNVFTKLPLYNLYVNPIGLWINPFEFACDISTSFLKTSVRPVIDSIFFNAISSIFLKVSWDWSAVPEQMYVL